MSEDYTYYGGRKVGNGVVTVKSIEATELDALREQVAKLTQLVNQALEQKQIQIAGMSENVAKLSSRVVALEQAQRPQPTGVVSVVDWEDNL